MNLSSHTVAQSISRFIGAWFLLSLFVGAYVGACISHEYHHLVEHARLHDDDAEANGCHRAIYHGEIGSCGHDTHITKAHLHCDLCHIWTYQQYDTPSIAIALSLAPAIPSHHAIPYRYAYLSSIAVHSLYLRGPPAV